MATTYSIDRVQAGESSLDNFNTPISQIQSALNQLSSSFSGMANKAAVLLYDAAIHSSCYQGALVYYDAANAVFKPAIAVLNQVPGDQGQSVQAASSRVVGMVLNINSTTATLLVGGSYTSGTLADTCLGINAAAGTYYLSPTTAGKATTTPGWNLRQPALEYYGDGKFSMGLFYMAHDNHHHAYRSLGAHWTTTTSGAPTGTHWYYDATADSTMTTVGELADGITAVFNNGVLQTPEAGVFVIQDGIIYTTLATAPTANQVAIINVFPFAYGDSVVRTVASSDGSIDVNNTNGTVNIKQKELTSGGSSYSASALSNIVDNEKLFTPIISSIQQGPGITVEATTVPGQLKIASSGLLGCALDAQDYQFNAAYRTTQGLFTYTTFPASRDSSIIIALQYADASTSTTTLQATLWGNAITGSGSLAVTLYFVPLSASGSSVLPSTGTSTTLNLGTIVQNNCNFVQSAAGMQFTGPGLLMASIAATAPSADVNFLRLGFIINTVA